jgi:tRNA(Ile)-lysidine synthase TilS/MesJ
MDVIPVIIKLNLNYNAHDTDYAFKYCKQHNIDPIVVDVDFDRFVKSGMMLDYAKRYRCELYQRSTTMYGISKLDGTIIMGDNEPYICKNTDGTWSYQLHEHDYALVNYFTENNILGTPHFGCWSSGINASFLTDPVMVELANNQVPGKLSSFSSKYKIYNNNSNFNLEVRPKYTGYELIEKSEIFNHETFKELEEFGKTCNGYYSENYFSFIDRLSR